MNKINTRIPIYKFSVAKEKAEIKRLFQQIIKVLSYVRNESSGIQNLISIRYLLREQFYVEYCAYIRSCPEGLQRCVCPVSDVQLIERVEKADKPCYTFCHAGLVDFAFPMARAKYPIVLAGGQFLFDSPTKGKKELLYSKVNDLPLDRKVLWSKMDLIPIIPLTTIKSLVALISTIPERFPERDVIEILSKISGQPSPKHEKINSVLSFLKSNFNEQLSLKEIAAKVGLSPCYLAHIFPQELGLSVMQYRKQLRLAAAKEMLRNTKLSITQIAYDLGWNDSNYFSFVFKNEAGLSPKSFRASPSV